MIFKDRSDAGRQLVEVIIHDPLVMKDKDRLVVASILRGGAVVGHEIAKKLLLPHIFLAIAKVRHPDNEELAIGAVCNGECFLDDEHIRRLQLTEKIVGNQIKKALKRQKEYQAKFIKKDVGIQNKNVIIVDDGIATGASVMAGFTSIKKQQAHKVILATPVAPFDFDSSPFDHTIILHKTSSFHAVSQFYCEFHQVKDQEIYRFQMKLQ